MSFRFYTFLLVALIPAYLIFKVTVGVNEAEASRVLESNGYTDIRITGYSFFGCSEDDFYQTGFEAISPNGSRVEGTVCSGLLAKGATIRFD